MAGCTIGCMLAVVCGNEAGYGWLYKLVYAGGGAEAVRVLRSGSQGGVWNMVMLMAGGYSCASTGCAVQLCEGPEVLTQEPWFRFAELFRFVF